MSEMVERAARAIWEKRRELAKDKHSIDLEEWGDGTIPRGNHVMEEARAVIEAMRQPTMEMCRDAAWDDYGPDQCQTCWQAMIDVALDTPSQITPHAAGS